MGSLRQENAIPIVEIGRIEEILFTDIEIDLVGKKLARFTLLCEQRPIDCENAGIENVVRMRATTLVERVPFMIRKTAYVLSQHWGRSGESGLMMPM